MTPGRPLRKVKLFEFCARNKVVLGCSGWVMTLPKLSPLLPYFAVQKKILFEFCCTEMINVEILTQTCTLQSVLGGTHEERVKEWMNQQKYIIKSTIK